MTAFHDLIAYLRNLGSQLLALSLPNNHILTIYITRAVQVLILYDLLHLIGE